VKRSKDGGRTWSRKIAAAEVSVSRLKARLREAGAIVDRQALPVIPPRQDP